MNDRKMMNLKASSDSPAEVLSWHWLEQPRKTSKNHNQDG
jgi:hypothetical protein